MADRKRSTRARVIEARESEDDLTAAASETTAPSQAREEEAREAGSSLDAERALGRNVAIGLPVVTVLGSIAVGMVTSIGPAILILAAGALVGAIAFFWTSLRTLAGDAALPEELELIASRPLAQAPAEARKLLLLRALKDLEHDHAVGKIDREDYEELAARYRDEAKGIMREMDDANEPLRRKAEEIARVHLEKRGLSGVTNVAAAAPKPAGVIAAATGDDEATVAEGAEDAETSALDDESTENVSNKPTTRPPPPGPISLVDDDGDDPGEQTRVAPSGLVAATLAAPEMRPLCPKCGTSNDADAAFCKKCATALTTEHRP